MIIRASSFAWLFALGSVALAAACGSDDTGVESSDAGGDASRAMDSSVMIDASSGTDAARDAAIADAAHDALGDAANDANDALADAVAPIDAAADAITDAPVDAFDAAPPPSIYCGHPADCAAGTMCAADGTCKPGNCSATAPCIFGFVCNAGTCASPTANACDDDAQCSAGALCINGTCTSPSNQCVDGSQCALPSAKCLQGKCVLGCATNADCRDGLACDVSRGTCSTPVKTCTITNDCGGATEVCTDGACVPRSNSGSCAAPGDVWFDNGCVPNEAISVACQTSGMQDACSAGSICLDHSCFISCDPPNQNACATQTIVNQCKPFSVNAMTYNVCATAQNLGNQCATNGMTCSGAAECVDGFCK